MPRIVVKDIEMLKVLTKYFGFAVVRQKGSHIRLTDGVHRVTIPYHNRELSQGVINSILKQAELTKEDIEKYL